MDACWSIPPSASCGPDGGRLGCIVGHRRTLAALACTVIAPDRPERLTVQSALGEETQAPARRGGLPDVVGENGMEVRCAIREGAEVEQHAVVPAERMERADGVAEVA